MQLLNPQFATRRRLQTGLVIAGGVAGALFGIALTKMGKIVADAPPATIGNYLWNATAFAALAAVVSPMVSWSGLRRVPLWRTVVEPLAIAVAGGATAVVVSSPMMLLVLPPVGLTLGFLNLRRRYPEPQR